MTYGTLATVKEILGISDTSDDPELNNCLTDADSQIDETLRAYTSVPLSSTPTEISQVSSLLAAGVFRNRRSSGEGDKFIVEARRRLALFVESNYVAGSFSSSGGLGS